MAEGVKKRRRRRRENITSFAAICRHAKVPRALGDAIFTEIVEECLKGNIVTVPHLGRFWAQETPPRKMKMPSGPASKKSRVVEIAAGMRLRFRVAQTFRAYLRKRLEGRARGTPAA